ncbi:MAG: hydrogenase maturation nickel metallochaperone HypA [Anaerolineae bacterium]|nr:hydrogenase maturation nickel metallochaperone HypA [Anaerolineae bacterium]
MHELSITQTILDIALKHANGAIITDIRLVIGDLTSLVDECIQFYWDIISENTNAVGAILHFKRIPAQAHCQACERDYAIQEEGLLCPHCRSHRVVITTGKEFFVESIDIKDDPA